MTRTGIPFEANATCNESSHESRCLFNKYSMVTDIPVCAPVTWVIPRVISCMCLLNHIRARGIRDKHPETLEDEPEKEYHYNAFGHVSGHTLVGCTETHSLI